MKTGDGGDGSWVQSRGESQFVLDICSGVIELGGNYFQTQCAGCLYCTSCANEVGWQNLSDPVFR